MRWRSAGCSRERFGLPFWQIATTATDANRFALRVARAVTGRREDPGLQRLLSRLGRRDDGAAGRRQAGQPARPGRRIPRPDRTTRRSSSSTTSRARERRSPSSDVACVITEPVLTNSCMVLPEPGFHDALRAADAPDRHAAADRRDAHHLDRSRRLHEDATAWSPTCSCSASRSPAACRRASGA